jgi:hypothetical protein
MWTPVLAVAYIAVGVVTARLWSRLDADLDSPTALGFVVLTWPLFAAVGLVAGLLWALGQLAGGRR